MTVDDFAWSFVVTLWLLFLASIVPHDFDRFMYRLWLNISCPIRFLMYPTTRRHDRA